MKAQAPLPACRTPAAIYGGFANQSIQSSYDQVGNLLSMTDWAGTITNAYDRLNRNTLSFSRTVSGVTNRIQNTFDIIGNRLRADYTINGTAQTISNAYDQLDRPVCVAHSQSHVSAVYGYNTNGKLATNTPFWVHCSLRPQCPSPHL
ncbi:MAG: hypothetical protein NTV22_15975 [bacterium]|nr:hypothetical protein [bacterium]